MNRLFSSSFAANGTPSNLAVILYTVANAPLPMVPTLLYLGPPRHSLTYRPTFEIVGSGVPVSGVAKILGFTLSAQVPSMRASNLQVHGFLDQLLEHEPVFAAQGLRC